MDLDRTCLICNNHFSNREEEERGLGDEKGWSLFCLLWKLLGISDVEGESSFKRVRVNLLKGQPWCGECHAVLDDLRRLHEEIEKAKRRQETMLEGVKFLVSDNKDRSECLEGAWAAHRLQLVKCCVGEADDGVGDEDNGDNGDPLTFADDDQISLPSSPIVEQKVDIRDCRVELKRLNPEAYEKKVPVPAVVGADEDEPPVRKSSRRKIPKFDPNYVVDEEGDCSDPDFEPEMTENHNSEGEVEETEGQGEIGVNPYKCRKCKLRFSSQSSRRAHYREKHNNAPFKCDICGECFKWKDYLRLHHERAHVNPPRPDKRRKAPTTWTCKHEGCGLTFSQKNKLVSHATTHSDIRPFKCEFCEYACKRKDCLVDHQRRIHKEQFEATFIGPKIAFPCDHCDKVYPTKPDLKLHMRSAHWRVLFLNEDGSYREGVELLKCPKDGCDYKHLLKTRVDFHFHRAHRYEQSLSFMCQYCGKGFKNAKGRKDHELIHVNKDSRPYVCEICGNSFAVPKSLYIHKRLSHEGHRFPSMKGRAAGANEEEKT